MAASERNCCYDLTKIPVKTVTIVDFKNSTNKISHGCLLGCYKNSNKNIKNPIQIFKKVEKFTDASIALGTFLYMKNWSDLLQYYNSKVIT